MRYLCPEVQWRGWLSPGTDQGQQDLGVLLPRRGHWQLVFSRSTRRKTPLLSGDLWVLPKKQRSRRLRGLPVGCQKPLASETC